MWSKSREGNSKGNGYRLNDLGEKVIWGMKTYTEYWHLERCFENTAEHQKSDRIPSGAPLLQARDRYLEPKFYSSLLIKCRTGKATFGLPSFFLPLFLQHDSLRLNELWLIDWVKYWLIVSKECLESDFCFSFLIFVCLGLGVCVYLFILFCCVPLLLFCFYWVEVFLFCFNGMVKFSQFV